MTSSNPIALQEGKFLRVTFITHYPELYGANRSLLNLIDGLQAHGVQASVVCRAGGPLTEELANRGVPFCVFPFRYWLNPSQPRHWLNGLARFLEIARSVPALKQQVAPWQPDIIYTNSSVIPIGALLARALGKPHVWHIREFAVEHFGLRHDLGGLFFRFWLNRAAAVIAISQSIKDGVLSGVRSKIHVIYNGVIGIDDLKKLAAPAVHPEAETDRFIFAIAGLLHPSKGQKEAIEALALVHRKHPQAGLLIAGTGENNYGQELQTLARDLGVAAQVQFLGFVDDIYAVFGRANAVLMCSRFEAMGRVTAEAMAAGKPVIGYNDAGTAEIVDHGKTGLLYEGGPKNLADAMENLIGDPALVLELGRNARKKAEEEFTVEAYAEKIFYLLNSIQAKQKQP